MSVDVAILTTEFFEPRLGGLGGYGWLARRAGSVLSASSGFGSVTYLTGARRGVGGLLESDLDGHRVVFGSGDRWRDLRRIRATRPDVFLAVDHDVGFLTAYRSRPRTPIVVWAQDPRGPDDWRRIGSLRVPDLDAPPEGVSPGDVSSLALVRRRARRWSRPFTVAVPSDVVTRRAAAAYGFEIPTPPRLPYPMPSVRQRRTEAGEPTVVFLGRLDPIKRPWVVVAAARLLPTVRFVLAGGNRLPGVGVWRPTDMPANVEAVGHLDGGAKAELLSQAWVLVNTSIHEALPVSFLEALAHGVPVVSAVDPDGLCSRFGARVPMAEGDGLGMVDDLVRVLRALVEDPDERRRRGDAGRRWVEQHHGEAAFVGALQAIIGAM